MGGGEFGEEERGMDRETDRERGGVGDGEEIGGLNN